MKIRGLFLCVFSILMVLLSGCGGKKVTRIDSESTTDLSGKWNDTDSRKVAKAMVQDCLSKPWMQRYSGDNYVPRIIVGIIRNKSHEHIDTETFTKDIERELLNSGKVEFVASKEERVQLRQEKADQMAGNASPATRKEAGMEAGADIMLYGSVKTIFDPEGGEVVQFYQVDLELVEVESNRKLWIGSKKIKKHVKRSKAKF
ncbi:MAG: penicillin-binding protein activator LpoB [Chitinivibrionales bacterium]